MQIDNFPITPLPDLSRYQAPATPGPRLRVCIATEEIVGPVRNGGIASTYYHLARLLTAQGHDVTVCYLKGTRVENKDADHWIKWYGDMGVNFVPMPQVDSDAPTMWQRRQYSFYQWLKNAPEPYDVVHVSEWRGGSYYALQARRLGLAFKDTLFLVKASSPHIWNRHYQMSFVNNKDMLSTMYPEQQSIELADMVIGGSAHLLRFMEHTGYTLPEGDTYVQPNVLLFDDVAVQDQRGPLEPGDRIHTKELTFFGRLEARKGLEIFCTALDYLVARGITPEKVSFVGKQGQNMPTTPDTRNLDVIMARARNWPFPIDIHTGFDQPDVLSFLTAAPRIAVMPSLIENSTMAAYEALLYKVPFIATRTGGTPELIAPEDHDDMLVDANPRSLADGLERVLHEGGKVGRCSFDNADNLATWDGFHDHLAGRKGDGTLTQIINRAPWTDAPSVSLCVFSDGNVPVLETFLDKAIFAAGDALTDITVAVTTPSEEATALAARHVNVTLVDASEMTWGEAWNAAAAQAKGAVLHFLRADIHQPLEGFAAKIAQSFSTPGLAAAGSVWQRRTVNAKGVEKLTRVVPMGDDLSLTALDYTHLSGRGVSIRTDHFKTLGGFDPIFAMEGIAQDLLMRARDLGRVVVIPEMLYREDPAAEALQLNKANAQYMAMNGLMKALDYPKKRVLHALNIRTANPHDNPLSRGVAAPTPPVTLTTPTTERAALDLTLLPIGGVLIQTDTPLETLEIAIEGATPEPLAWDSDAAGSSAYLDLPSLIGGEATWPRQIDIAATTGGQTLTRQIRTEMQAGGAITLSADAPGLQEVTGNDTGTPRLISLALPPTDGSIHENAMRMSFDAAALLLYLWSPHPRPIAARVEGAAPMPMLFTPFAGKGLIAALDLGPLLAARDTPLTLELVDQDEVFRTITLTPGPRGLWGFHAPRWGMTRSVPAALNASSMTALNVSRAAVGSDAGLNRTRLGLDERYGWLLVRRPKEHAGQTLTVVTDQGGSHRLHLAAGPRGATAGLNLRHLSVTDVTRLTLHDGAADGPVLRQVRLCPGADNVLAVAAADGGTLLTLGRAGQFPENPGGRGLHNLSHQHHDGPAPRLMLRLKGSTLHLMIPRARQLVTLDLRGAGRTTHLAMTWQAESGSRGLLQKVRSRLMRSLPTALRRGTLIGKLDLAPLLETPEPLIRSLILSCHSPGLTVRRTVLITYDSDGVFYVASPENVIEGA
ncbi:glycosyltransferase [Yoonia sp. R2331]|uniref:glycosyltransferase n=1 Tax=Yoonia sp. R2331 TaxID=3237238 RepID=UPI0034E417F6